MRGLAPADLDEISMEEAVGYPTVECHSESRLGGTLTLKHGRMFLVADRRGDLDPPGHCGLGFYHDDTRFLSHYRLALPGDTVSVLSCQDRSMYGAQIDLAVPDHEVPGADVRSNRHSVHVRREMLLDDRLVERVTLTSYLPRPVDYWVDLAVGVDFADIFEVRGWMREERGRYYRPLVDGDCIDYGYRGTDGRMLRTHVHFVTPPHEVRPDGARWRPRLRPGASAVMEWQVVPDVEPERTVVLPGADLEDRWEPLAAGYRSWRKECTGWQSDVEAFNTTVEQAVVDMHALYVEADGHDIISAGIPWYSTAFGRDSIITSLQTLSLNPRIARETLLYLAHHQGEKEDPFTEEQPGRILHEIRRGELARSGDIPHVPYYGTVDATPLWLVLLHETWRWTGDGALVQRLLPHAERALEWIDDWGDLDGDGLVEYARTSDRGLVNQGWKDSGDAVPFPDGRLAEPPIALVEVQGYVYDAKVRTASLYAAFGREAEAERLRAEAAELREKIQDLFWMEEEGTFALALDGRKRPVPTATSNAGHLLWSRVPTAEQAARMAGHFATPEMFSGWGLRTLSATHPVFNPMSYHNGSIWPHDNALVGLGLALNGQTQMALWIFTALHEAATGLTYHRLPELYCGMERAGGSSPVLYPVSCSPQAWAAGAVFMLLQAATGILPDGPAGELHIREPELPPFLDALDVTGLHVGGARADLRFRRHRGRTMANLLGVEGGPLNVKIELAG